MSYLLLGAALAVLTDRSALGTVGFAEWEVETPGGHRISHIDPLKARFGTCLRNPGEDPQLIRTDPADVSITSAPRPSWPRS